MLILLSPAPGRRVQLEVPQEVVGLLEVWPHSEDFVDQVLHADDVILAWNTEKEQNINSGTKILDGCYLHTQS